MATSTSTSTSAAATCSSKSSNCVGDDTEDQLGISVYLSPDHEGFSAVLKARYSDFVVHEVGPDGTVARLDSLDPNVSDGTEADEAKKEEVSTTNNSKNEEEQESRKRKRDESKEQLPWEVLQTELEQFVGKGAAEPVLQFLQKETKQEDQDITVKKETENGSSATKMYIALPPIQDKNTRRNVHHWIRKSLEFCARADTADDDQGNKVIRLWPLKFERKMPDYGKFDHNGRRVPNSSNNNNNKQRRPSGYLQFVLYKENCDTNSAIKQVTRRLGGRGGKHHNNNKVRAGYAGMKDKRGITSQFCTLQHIAASQIAWVNNPSNLDNSNRQGGGNSSKGGVAVVRVGNFSYVTQEMRLGTLQGNRFDVALRNVKTNKEHDLPTTKQVLTAGAEALRKNGFINYFGTQRFGKYHDTHLCGFAFLQGDFKKICDIIFEPKEGEQQHISEAKAKWQKRFSGLKEDSTNEDRSKAEGECAKAILRCFGRFMASEVSILESLSRKPLDYKRAFSCINKTMRMMFLHAAQSLLWNQVASFRIETLGRDIVVGDLVLKGNTESHPDDINNNNPSVRMVTKEDITAGTYNLEDVVLPLLGTKSKRPENESGKLFDKLLEDNGLNVNMFKNIQDRNFSCPGDYRKLICRPSDVEFTIVEYKDPYQPLLQTDLMKLNGVEVLKEDENNETKSKLLGMVVGFTLPSSAYATIALRELMKKPTSSEYQSELSLGGPSSADADEHNVTKQQ